MRVDQSEGLIQDRLIVKFLEPIFFYRTDLEKLDLHQKRPKMPIQKWVDVVNYHPGPGLGTQTQ